MTLEEALYVLNKGGRVISQLCKDTGINRTTIDAIMSGRTKNPQHETALKIIKWVEEN